MNEAFYRFRYRTSKPVKKRLKLIRIIKELFDFLEYGVKFVFFILF